MSRFVQGGKRNSNGVTHTPLQLVLPTKEAHDVGDILVGLRFRRIHDPFGRF